MVFGNTGDRSATGVGFTRNPATGAKEFYGEFLINAQGEDVVSGMRTPQPITRAREGAAEGLQAAARDHDAAREALQGRAGLRVHDPGREALHAADAQRQAHRLCGRRHRDRSGRTRRLCRRRKRCCWSIPKRCRSCSSPGFDPKEWAKIPMLAKGLPASPGAASGQVVFTADDAVEWTRQGKQVILVRKETVPDDIHGMHVAQGILTATGGMTSHAAVVGRQMGKPSIVGAGALHDFRERASSSPSTARPSRKGDFVSFDGLNGEVKLGQGGVEAERDSPGRQRQARSRRSRTSTSASTSCSSGPTSSAGWASAPTRIFRIRPSWRTRSAPAASACAAPSTCSSARVACRSCSG